MALITLEDVKKNKEVETYIRMADEHLAAQGITEHGFRHLNLVSHIAHNILARLGYGERYWELAAIAGYLHDIGNTVSRYNHGQTGAILSWHLLRDMGMSPDELAVIIGAIGNHEEQYGQPVNAVSAALILADKSDVHRTRVRNDDFASFDIHDRVNYAVEKSFLRVNPEAHTVTLELTIDIKITPVLDYFEIFMERMLMCRRAAAFLKTSFELTINGSRLL